MYISWELCVEVNLHAHAHTHRLDTRAPSVKKNAQSHPINAVMTEDSVNMSRKSRTRALRSTDLPAYSAALAAAPHPVRATRHHGNPFNSPCSDITFAVALFYMSESVQPSIYFTGSERERRMRVVLGLLHPDTHTQQNTENISRNLYVLWNCFLGCF